MSNPKVRMVRPRLGVREKFRVNKVLSTGNLAQGAEVLNFEKSFSQFVQGRRCVAVNSGTSGLQLALLALGIGPGDEVLVPDFTFAATGNAVMLVGATPVFVDIEPDTFNIDPSKIERSINKKTKAVMPVHLYGMPSNMTAIQDLCKKYSLILIEDAAQSHGASILNQAVGTFGEAAVFSFYPTKNVTSGEGGIVVVRDEHTELILRKLRNQGMIKRYENEMPGFNMRLSDIHAAIGIEQIKKLKRFNRERQKIAKRYTSGLTDRIVKPKVVDDSYEHVFHQYTIRVKNGKRDDLAKHLARSGIETGIYYPTPLSQLKYFGPSSTMPEAKLASSEVLSLPIYPSLSWRKQKLVIETINDYFASEEPNL